MRTLGRLFSIAPCSLSWPACDTLGPPSGHYFATDVLSLAHRHTELARLCLPASGGHMPRIATLKPLLCKPLCTPLCIRWASSIRD
ncbi:hypothetical protein BDZ90DRAFT_232694 [Jaminaea rosea]|uniref:Uncharacterized protein n=1 Tax=Jaminaea rosea TaxID=1569628 RepID=A0A316UPB4_9BASI|nr:hypothetical protein BDZ90DRAFT_232694 [Jaminaea rosea]PWN27137.1 hypothetical protein BDZ90DRAFT_232694 [Jaminaea rosea]